MFYFDFQNPIHLAFVGLAAALAVTTILLIIFNSRRPVPVQLPERVAIGDDHDGAPQDAMKLKDRDSFAERRDPVEIFVLAPETVPYGSMFRIFININNFRPTSKGRQQVGKTDWEAIVAELKAGERVGLILQCSNLFVDAPYQALSWDQVNHVAVFNARAPRDETVRATINKLLVMVGEHPIGEIAFSIRFDGEAKHEEGLTLRPNQRLTVEDIGKHERGLVLATSGFKANRFSTAFISYSHENKNEMALFCSGLEARGVDLKMRDPSFDIDIKVDAFDFRTGQHWDVQARALIAESDIFFLLWSKDAESSDAVRSEIEHAITCQSANGRPRIHPVVVKRSQGLGAPPGVESKMLWAGRFTNLMDP